MKHLAAFLVILSSLGILLNGCVPPKVGGSFTYDLPSFHIALQGINFEYARYGVKAEVRTHSIFSDMYNDLHLGVVNSALKQINEQIPAAQTQSGHYALVNVITDIHNVRRVWVSRDLYGSVTGRDERKSGLEVLVIRADVIKILPPHGQTSELGLQATPAEGFYPWTDAGKQLFAEHLVPLIQSHSMSNTDSTIDIALKSRRR